MTISVNSLFLARDVNKTIHLTTITIGASTNQHNVLNTELILIKIYYWSHCASLVYYDHQWVCVSRYWQVDGVGDHFGHCLRKILRSCYYWLDGMFGD